MDGYAELIRSEANQKYAERLQEARERHLAALCRKQVSRSVPRLSRSRQWGGQVLSLILRLALVR